jgi:hypothetical protein
VLQKIHKVSLANDWSSSNAVPTCGAGANRPGRDHPVALRYWKRMREQAAVHAEDPVPRGANPWEDRPARTLGQLGALQAVSDDDRAARYRDWAARLRDQGSRHAAEPAPPAPSSAAYWSSDALFEESRRLEQEEAPTAANPGRTGELLAELDLRPGATPAEIAVAYRRLAKQHHPDRFVNADPGTEAFHAARMRRIIDAYQLLRHRENV